MPCGLGGRIQDARDIHYRIMDVVDALFVEPNPTPVKQAVEWLGSAGGPVAPAPRASHGGRAGDSAGGSARPEGG